MTFNKMSHIWDILLPLYMIKDTRQTIIDSAILVFNEDLSAPLEKVAERSDVTRRTLHRYFKDRKELMESCEMEVQKACFLSMTAASNSSEDPLEKLKNMFDAGINCGIKYTFLHKLHHLSGHSHSVNKQNCSDYDKTLAIWNGHLLFLQKKGLIDQQITIDWIQMLYNGIVSASFNSSTIMESSKDEIKKFAWFSFSRGIGI